MWVMFLMKDLMMEDYEALLWHCTMDHCAEEEMRKVMKKLNVGRWLASHVIQQATVYFTSLITAEGYNFDQISAITTNFIALTIRLFKLLLLI